MKINEFLRVVDNNLKVLVFEENEDAPTTLLASGYPEELLDIGAYFEKEFHIAAEGVEGSEWKRNFENYHVRSFRISSAYQNVIVDVYHPTLPQKLDQEYIELKEKVEKLDNKIKEVDKGLCDDIDISSLMLLQEQLYAWVFTYIKSEYF